MTADTPPAKTHISLNVHDIERSVTFYEAFFGEPAHKRRPGYANFDISNPPLKLALQEAPPDERGLSRLSHLGIVMPTSGDVDAVRIRLIEAGLATFDEGDTVCCYARQDKVWATDPDGNGWEVYVLLDEMDEHDNEHFGTGGVAAKVAEDCGCEAEAVCCAPIVTGARRGLSLNVFPFSG